MGVLIVNSGCANLSSVKFALERQGVSVKVSDCPKDIKSADRVILPGVGSYDFAMEKIEQKGLIDCLKNLSQPTLGICLGMQLLFEGSSEGESTGLGKLKGQAELFPEIEGLPVPHMGWNQVSTTKEDPLFNGIAEGENFYFVHSYYLPLSDETIAKCNYGNKFAASVRKDNFWGCQFHPERSGEMGAKILSNFMEFL